jgi:hypothetical protein
MSLALSSHLNSENGIHATYGSERPGHSGDDAEGPYPMRLALQAFNVSFCRRTYLRPESLNLFNSEIKEAPCHLATFSH